MKALEDTTKEEFFGLPKISEILEGKNRVDRSKDIVASIENLKDNEYLLIDWHLVPYIDEQGDRLYSNWHNFLNRGPKINIANYQSRTAAITKKLAPYELREQKFNAIKGQEYSATAGYYWTGIRDTAYKNVSLDDCIEGCKLFAFSEKNSKEKNKIRINNYDGKRDVWNFGGKYIIDVPSRNTKTTHRLSLESVPIGDKLENYANIWDLRSNHSCGRTATSLSYKHKMREDIFCAHIIAAYIYTARERIYENKDDSAARLNPFALPSQKVMDYRKRLVDNVIVKIADPERGIAVPKRRLNKAEREILLWGFVNKYGNPRSGKDRTFYASGEKIQDYDW